jgi:ribosome-binding protein aMBF1 (putative translation factor)
MAIAECVKIDLTDFTVGKVRFRMGDRSPQFILMDNTGWTTVVKKKKKSKPKEEQTNIQPSLSSAASRVPQTKHVVFKDEVHAMQKLAAANEPVKSKYLSLETRQEITNRRVSKLWTQADLNKYCSFPVNTIREIESGRVSPSTQQLHVLNRILKGGIHYA